MTRAYDHVMDERRAKLASEAAQRAWIERKKNARLRGEVVTLRALAAMLRSHLDGRVSHDAMEDALRLYETQAVLRTLEEL